MKNAPFFARVATIALVISLFGLFPGASTAQQYPSLSSPPQLTKTGSKDVAVIVAVERYAFLPDVPGAMVTANDWETFFRRGLGVEKVFVQTNSAATRENMLRFAQRAAEDVGKGGTVWFVFVGHGAPAPDGSDGLLIGMDAQGTVDSLSPAASARANCSRHWKRANRPKPWPSSTPASAARPAIARRSPRACSPSSPPP